MSTKEKGDQEIESIKNQLRAEKVNRLPVVAAVWTKGKQGRSDSQLTKEVMEEYKASGYEVDRQGFGLVDFGEKAVDKAVHYANTDAEFAAIFVAKKVVKRGIEIHSHLDHKNRGYLSTTFAAPVEVNGIKGIEAVLVKGTKENRFTVARILAPDGTAFLFEQKRMQNLPLAEADPRPKPRRYTRPSVLHLLLIYKGKEKMSIENSAFGTPTRRCGKN